MEKNLNVLFSYVTKVKNRGKGKMGIESFM